MRPSYVDTSDLLIVDDESSTRSALQRTLRRLDGHIPTAGDGVEALSILENRPAGAFAVAMVDLCMSGMDGLELLVEIKRRSPATQVLLLSGKGTIPTAVRAMRLGADDFLEKRFDPDELQARIRSHLRRVRRQKEMLRYARTELARLESSIEETREAARASREPLAELDAYLDLASRVRRPALRSQLLNRAKKDVRRVGQSISRVVEWPVPKGGSL